MVVNLWFWHCDANESTCQIIEKVWWFYLILPNFSDAFSIQINAWLADIQNRSQKSLQQLKTRMQAAIKVINAWFRPCQQPDGPDTKFPILYLIRQSPDLRRITTCRMLQPVSRAAVAAVSRVIVSMAASIMGRGLITPRWPWYWRPEDKRRIFNLLFIMFSRSLSQQQQMHFWHYLSDIKDKVGDSGHRATFV